ncbi:MAG TPA: HAD-IA family hydrolase [Fimbriimonadaceae bacterium]|nr:HAD-IA family hydrolase [Fimbriimonadaceae bacterium]
MRPTIITLDAAETLVRVLWKPGPFAIELAQDLGLAIDPQPAQETYEGLLRTRWTHYCSVNQTRDVEACDGFWHELTRDWLERIGSDVADADRIVTLARERLYNPTGLHFQLFEDTVPALELLKQEGFRLAVISNWDYSLHRILRNLGIYDYFEKVIASLEEGPEKPDPALFDLTLRALGADPEEALHVGDNPVDDYQGARGAGMRAALVDRSRDVVSPPYIPSLLHITEAVDWSA